MSVALAILVTLGVLWFLWRFIRSLFLPSQPAEPVDDPFSLVPAPRKDGPKGRVGAVALEEPEEDEPGNLFPPRTM
jgi:hypothetical protein